MEDVKLREKIREFLSIDYGDGSGCGSGDGYGSGYGDGYGDGSGYGSGGLSEINGHKVYLVDSVPTIFTSIHDNVAREGECCIIPSSVTVSA